MFWTFFTSSFLGLTSAFLILIVLLQRGRGGGLAGAFGGAGGQSAFGTKAGDVFTKITVVVALIWVVLAGVTGFAMLHDAKQGFVPGSDSAPENPELGKPAGQEDAASETSDEADPIGNPQPEDTEAQNEEASGNEPSNSGEDDREQE